MINVIRMKPSNQCQLHRSRGVRVAEQNWHHLRESLELRSQVVDDDAARHILCDEDAPVLLVLKESKTASE